MTTELAQLRSAFKRAESLVLNLNDQAKALQQELVSLPAETPSDVYNPLADKLLGVSRRYGKACRALTHARSAYAWAESRSR
jgi:hypothetical protein